MGNPDSGRVAWFDPDPRAIIPLEPGTLRVTRSLRQRVRSARFRITADQDFGRVIRACAAPRADDGVWISAPIINAYCLLHRYGHAHSVEAWLDTHSGEQLVGGLYGLAIGGLFAGESMFCRPDLGGTDASKVCLVHLVGHLRRRGYTLLDTQFSCPNTAQFGCINIERDEYHARLAAAVSQPVSWAPFEALGSDEAPVGHRPADGSAAR